VHKNLLLNSRRASPVYETFTAEQAAPHKQVVLPQQDGSDKTLMPQQSQAEVVPSTAMLWRYSHNGWVVTAVVSSFLLGITLAAVPVQ
jgi:hypothetical protein